MCANQSIACRLIIKVKNFLLPIFTLNNIKTKQKIIDVEKKNAVLIYIFFSHFDASSLFLAYANSTFHIFSSKQFKS